MSYLQFIQLALIAPVVVKAENMFSHKELSIYIKSWGYPQL